jgi:uncharacterized membrane protein YbhN (UPF0104 family)
MAKESSKWARVKHGVLLAVFAALVVWAASFIFDNQQNFRAILHVDWPYALGLLAATLTFFAVQGVLLRVSVATYGVSLEPVEWFGLTVVTFFANYAIPFSGIGIRGAYLKKARGLPYSDFVSALAVVLALDLFVFGLAGLAGLAALPFLGLEADPVIALILGGLLIGVTLGWRIPPRRIPALGRLLSRVRAFLENLQSVNSDPAILGRLTALTIALFATYAVMFAFAFKALSLQVPAVASLLAASFSNLAAFVRIAPAAIGTFDGTVIYVSHVVGLTIAEGLLVAILVRAGIVICSFSLAPYFFYRLFRPKAIA